MEGRTLLVFEFSGKNVPQLSTKPKKKATPFEKKADYLASTSILGFNMFCFQECLAFFPRYDIYSVYIYTYIYIYT